MLIEPVFSVQHDALSQVLDLLRLRGTSVQTGSFARAQKTRFEAASPSIYVARRGSLHISGHKSEHVGNFDAGDVALFLRGGRHELSGENAAYLRGEFGFDSVVAERFLSALPETIVLRCGGEPYPWVDISCAFILDEAMHGLAGAASMISRLLDLLFVRTIRTWASEGGSTSGWLAGAVDERIGRVLAQMHQHFDKDWTLLTLANLAPMSRTAFANRFLLLVGVTPIAYLNSWRLDRATEMLRNTGLSVADISERVGYGSNAAFTRAFKLRYGSSPTHWREAHKLAW